MNKRIELQGPYPAAILITVLVTFIVAVIVASELYDRLAEFFRNQHNLPPIRKTFLWTEWFEKAPVTPSMIGWGKIFGWVVLPSIAKMGSGLVF